MHHHIDMRCGIDEQIDLTTELDLAGVAYHRSETARTGAKSLDLALSITIAAAATITALTNVLRLWLDRANSPSEQRNIVGSTLSELDRGDIVTIELRVEG